MAKQRQSNFELLRIVAMILIIGTHALSCTNPDKSGMLMDIIQTICVYGVNLFGLITGYFMVKQTSVSLQKIVKMLLDVAFYGVIMYGLSIVVGINSFSFTGLVKAAVPMLAGYRWFVVAYIVLFSLSPFINTSLSHITERSYLMLLAICGIFFSLWPTFLPHPPLDDYGYSFNHLIFVYLIGGYIRLYVRNVKVSACIVVLLAAMSCTIGIPYLQQAGITMLGTAVGYSTAYNSVFILTASVAIFLIFSKINIHSSMINTLASSAFAVFLLHGDYNMMDYLFNEVFHVNAIYSSPFWFLIFPLFMTFIYLVFASIDQIKQFIVDKPLYCVLKKIEFVNLKITASEE